MKVLVISGSQRNGQTDRLLRRFEDELKAHGEVEFEYLYLRNLKLQTCIGCAACLELGEEKCPLKDDRDMVLQKLNEAEGIIFASPNYSMQVTGCMKVFYDRFAYIFHRPCLFGKTSMAFVTQGVYGGSSIIKYINEVSGFWGMNICKGISFTTPWGVRNPKIEYPEAEDNKINEKIKEGAARFYSKLQSARNPSPSLKRMFFFRLTRSAHKYSKDRKRDYEYFRQKGWFEADYFYDASIGLHKRLIGGLIDRLMAGQAKKENA
jgi:multimeric flavodoxin WrbA